MIYHVSLQQLLVVVVLILNIIPSKSFSRPFISFPSSRSFKIKYSSENTESLNKITPKISRDSRLGATNSPVIQAEGSGSPCRIKVIGVGGGGGNAVNRMMESATGVLGVELWAVNTDAQALSRNLAPMKLTIGKSTSRGLGAGGSPKVGALAAEESKDEIMNIVKSADLVFVTAGMGGGTGSGAAPVVARCAKDAGALTIGVVTKPFGFEGRKRMQQAKKAILQLKDNVDTLIVVSNDKLLQIVPENTPLTDAFLVADDVLRQGVVGISEIIIKPGLVNVDFADVRTIMGNAGTSLMGIGVGKGKNRAEDAAKAAISSPLLDFPITKAKGIVFNIVGGRDMTLTEVNRAANVVYQSVDSDANIIFGALVDDRITSEEISITVLATGFAADYFDCDDENEEMINGIKPGTPLKALTKLEISKATAGSVLAANSVDSQAFLNKSPAKGGAANVASVSASGPSAQVNKQGKDLAPIRATGSSNAAKTSAFTNGPKRYYADGSEVDEPSDLEYNDKPRSSPRNQQTSNQDKSNPQKSGDKEEDPNGNGFFGFFKRIFS